MVREFFTDVFLVGSGPASATYARLLLDSTTDQKLWMAEMGPVESPTLGENLKNGPYFQRNIAAFQHYILGHLHSLAPPDSDLPGAAGTYSVGGMATREFFFFFDWTCATPRPHRDELPDTYSDVEWDRLYTKAEKLIGTNHHPFDDLVSQQIIHRALATDPETKDRQVKGLPLAVKVPKKNLPHLRWSGTDTIMQEQFYSDRLTLKSNTHVRRLVHENGKVSHAVCHDLLTSEDYIVKAKAFVIGGGATLTPQLMFASGIGNDNVGRYLSDHPTAFCQVVLADCHFEWARKNSQFDEALAEHRKQHPTDKVPIPLDEPEPQLFTPYTAEYPWHTQIHRESFQYGNVSSSLDQRRIIHLRWYTKQDPLPTNRITFDSKLDVWGMPRPIFKVSLSADDVARNERSMEDMKKFARALGDYLPGVEPHWRPYGQALHVTSTTRIGSDPATSVLDPSSRVHGFENCWVGGNNVLPVANSVNPTLTSMAFAIKGAEELVKAFGWGEARSKDPSTTAHL